MIVYNIYNTEPDTEKTTAVLKSLLIRYGLFTLYIKLHLQANNNLINLRECLASYFNLPVRNKMFRFLRF